MIYARKSLNCAVQKQPNKFLNPDEFLKIFKYLQTFMRHFFSVRSTLQPESRQFFFLHRLVAAFTRKIAQQRFAFRKNAMHKKTATTRSNYGSDPGTLGSECTHDDDIQSVAWASEK